MLDTAQLAVLLLSLDLVLLLPEWAVTGTSAVLMSQATSWQWVPFECLLPGESAASGAVLQSILVMLLPGKCGVLPCSNSAKGFRAVFV
jgi:hypothetical protein